MPIARSHPPGQFQLSVHPTEFDTVFIQPDVCNGCRDCVSACPYGVIEMDQHKGVAQKCTLCYDRQRDGLEPACAKSCPTDSIVFGPISQLQARARRRLEQPALRSLLQHTYRVLLTRGMKGTFIYSTDYETQQFLHSLL